MSQSITQDMKYRRSLMKYAEKYGVARQPEVQQKLCDKVAIIKGGKLIRSGTMEAVKGDDSLEDVFLELEGESC